jgi:hypothetical protein
MISTSSVSPLSQLIMRSWVCAVKTSQAMQSMYDVNSGILWKVLPECCFNLIWETKRFKGNFLKQKMIESISIYRSILCVRKPKYKGH